MANKISNQSSQNLMEALSEATTSDATPTSDASEATEIPLNPIHNSKNQIILAKISKPETKPSLSPTEIIEKMVKDPFYLFNTTKKLIDVTIHPELLEPENTESSFFSKTASLFFRNYFKIILLMLFAFQIVYFNANIHDSKLKMILISFAILFIIMFIILINAEQRINVVLLTTLLFVVVGPLFFGYLLPSPKPIVNIENTI